MNHTVWHDLALYMNKISYSNNIIISEDIPEENKIIFKENVGDKDKGLIQVDVFFDGLCKKSR